MENENPYIRTEILSQLQNLMELVQHLDNCKSSANVVAPERENDMANRLTERVTVNGKERVIHGYSRQDLHESYVDLLVKEGLVIRTGSQTSPLFGNYIRDYYATYKQNQQANTVVNRERILRNHVLPELGEKPLDQINTTQIQRWFNKLAKVYARETLLKIKNTLSPVFNRAVEEGFIDKNPLCSKDLEIAGKETVHHQAIPREKMREIRQGISSLPYREKMMAALLCYTGLRFEEILGLRWEDVSDTYLAVNRAVVHPKRNAPEIKPPKTKTSFRQIPVHPELKVLLDSEKVSTGFILASKKNPTNETPLSYAEARRAYEKIRDHFDIAYTPHDFRDTCATEWRENGMQLDVIARLLGHSKTETTEKRYVKYRDAIINNAIAMM